MHRFEHTPGQVEDIRETVAYQQRHTDRQQVQAGDQGRIDTVPETDCETAPQGNAHPSRTRHIRPPVFQRALTLSVDARLVRTDILLVPRHRKKVAGFFVPFPEGNAKAHSLIFSCRVIWCLWCVYISVIIRLVLFILSFIIRNLLSLCCLHSFFGFNSSLPLYCLHDE